MHAVIRADGGPDLGYGHLIRSGALAEELLRDGHTVTVATTTPDTARTVFPDGVGTVPLGDRGDPDQFRARVDLDRMDVAFTDAYPVDTAYQRAVRERVPLVVWQDDARHAVCADAFVNGNLYAPDLNYEFLGSRPRTYLGTDYVLLRDAIRTVARRSPPWRERPTRAIVVMGGSDVAGRTPTVVRAFDGWDGRVDAVIGPGCSSILERRVREAAAAVSTDTRVVRDPDDLPERLFQADFAVSTTSTTTYELLALGTPMVGIPVVDNQERVATALEERDAATVLDRGADRPAFEAAIETYVTDPELRRERRRTGRRLVDGQGTRRTADVMDDAVDC